MARIVDTRCPRCGAPLPVAPELDAVACHYCGARSLVDRGRKPAAAPPPPGMHVVRVAPPSSGAGALGLVLGLVLAAGAVATATAFLRSPGSSRAGAPVVGDDPRYYFSDRPMLADVNGDGAPDVIGRSKLPVGTQWDEWIAAYDGRDGKPIWKAGVLSKDAASHEARRAIVLGRVISVDALGKVQAYDQRTGAPSWSAQLGEKARRICQGDGTIVVETLDDARHGLDPASGAKRALAKDAPCKPVPSSDGAEAPGYQIIGWSQFAAFGLPSLHAVEGIMAHRALVPSEPGPRFLLGSRDKGSQVAMVAAVDRGKVLWMSLVPGVDPLTTSVNVTTQQAAYAGGLLVIPYDMKDRDGGMRMACFEGATGKRLWDVQIHKKTQGVAGLAVSASDIFVSSWTALYVLSLKTGQIRYALGTEL
ncbi:outer membrane protein assembly factor BamB family protein [Sorangium sp. So ce131]|uniref:outer membrane protein assembly factor BamB family protein n=1 Tax=Sorangium sp. So ce131 TaxID=3133282 RepID=UPI003F5F632C